MPIKNPTIFFFLHIHSLLSSPFSIALISSLHIFKLTAMALSRLLCLITMALLFCSVIAQSPSPSPVPSPKKSPTSSPTPVSSPPKASVPSPSKTPTATPPSPATVASPPSSSPSPVTSPTSISETPAEAPGPAENSAVLNLNRFVAAGSVAVGVLAAVMVL